MGYIRHHAILVTSYQFKDIQLAFVEASRIFGETGAPVTQIMKSGMNGYRSFVVLPDGSKEGWSESDKADEARKEFILYLDQQRYSDGSTSLDWVEVQYGDDNRESKIVRYSDEQTVDQVDGC